MSVVYLSSHKPTNLCPFFDSADALQSLSFALCHVYARSTRSVSIPAPVYCQCTDCWMPFYDIHILVADADIVCSRAKNHFDPSDQWDLIGSEDTASVDTSKAKDSLDKFQRGFKPLHSTQKTLMYFSVSPQKLIDTTYRKLIANCIHSKRRHIDSDIPQIPVNLEHASRFVRKHAHWKCYCTNIVTRTTETAMCNYKLYWIKLWTDLLAIWKYLVSHVLGRWAILLARKTFGFLVQPPIASVEVGSESQPSTVWQKEIRCFSICGAIKQFLFKNIYSE